MSTFRPLIIFAGITFAISWGLAALFWAAMATGLVSVEDLRPALLPLLLLGVWAPNIAALATARITEGRHGTRDLLGRITIWRIGWFWWVAAFLLPFLLWNLAILGAKPFAEVSFSRWMPSSGGALLQFVAMNLISGPIGEALGWRGFTLPRLTARIGALPASLVIGAGLGAVASARLLRPAFGAPRPAARIGVPAVRDLRRVGFGSGELDHVQRSPKHSSGGGVPFHAAIGSDRGGQGSLAGAGVVGGGVLRSRCACGGDLEPGSRGEPGPAQGCRMAE